MRYLRYFENDGVRKYWLVPIDEERFESALDKISCHSTEYFSTIDILRSVGTKYIYVTYSLLDGWSYFTYHNYYKTWLDNNNYVYMGSVNIPDYEIDIVKYNL